VSIEEHRQRFTDHRNEFIAQEVKLLQWGLKHVLRNFHQYFWSRITRSLLVKDLTCELYRSAIQVIVIQFTSPVGIYSADT